MKKREVQLTHANGKVEIVQMTDLEIAILAHTQNHPKIYIIG